MNDDTSFSVGPAAGWQLLAELQTTTDASGSLQMEEQLRAAVSTLALPQLLLAPIHTALLQSVRRLARAGQRTEPVAPLRIRIWVAPEYKCGRGWGFFLVEKPGGKQEGDSLKTGSLVELFLYQEAHTS